MAKNIPQLYLKLKLHPCAITLNKKHPSTIQKVASYILPLTFCQETNHFN